MEGEKQINVNEPIKNPEESHEGLKKGGIFATAFLSAFLNAAEVQAGYEAPMVPDAEHTQTIPKSAEEKAVPADAVLEKGMTKPQIETAAKAAVEKYEMNKAFQEVLRKCEDVAGRENPGDTAKIEQASQMCVDWYKAEVAKGNWKPALEIIQQNFDKIEKDQGEALLAPFLGVIKLAGYGIGALVTLGIAQGLIQVKNGTWDRQRMSKGEYIDSIRRRYQSSKSKTERDNLRDAYFHLTEDWLDEDETSDEIPPKSEKQYDSHESSKSNDSVEFEEFQKKKKIYEGIIQTSKAKSERDQARKLYKLMTGHEYEGEEYQGK